MPATPPPRADDGSMAGDGWTAGACAAVRDGSTVGDDSTTGDGFVAGATWEDVATGGGGVRSAAEARAADDDAALAVARAGDAEVAVRRGDGTARLVGSGAGAAP